MRTLVLFIVCHILYIISVKEWTEKTNAIGIFAKAGRYGGTYAYKDIAFEFGMWISPEFKIYLIKEFERLKEQEWVQLGWNAKRELAKINYRIHTEAIKENLIPNELSPQQISVVYASEADVLNVALFGKTAKQWRDENPEKKGNIRDYASINELICLSNMENINAVLIQDGVIQKERLIKLNQIARNQIVILEGQKEKFSVITAKPDKSIQLNEKEHMARLKAKAQKGKLMLDE